MAQVGRSVRALLHSRAGQCLFPSQRALCMRCTYFENVLCKVSPSFAVTCYCQYGDLFLKLASWLGGGTAAGLQIRNDRVKQMREKSLLCQNVINARLDFFLRLLWSSHWTVICGYTSLCYRCLPSAVDFGDGQPPWQTSVLRLYHMLVFLVFTPAEDADCLFLGTGSSLLLQAALLENSTRQMSFPFIDQTDSHPTPLIYTTSAQWSYKGKVHLSFTRTTHHIFKGISHGLLEFSILQDKQFALLLLHCVLARTFILFFQSYYLSL